MLSNETIRAEDVDELEDHLRQMVEDLSEPQPVRAAALSAEEAFLIASRRLGGAQAIASEFAKSDPGAVWRRRWIWMLGGFIGISLVSTVIRTAASILRAQVFSPNSIGGAILYSAIVFLGITGVIALAYRASRAGTSHGAFRFAARALSNRVGIVGLALLAMAPWALLVPLGWVISSPDATVRFSRSSASVFAQLGLSFAPIAALTWLLWSKRRHQTSVTS